MWVRDYLSGLCNQDVIGLPVFFASIFSLNVICLRTYAWMAWQRITQEYVFLYVMYFLYLFISSHKFSGKMSF